MKKIKKQGLDYSYILLMPYFASMYIPKVSQYIRILYVFPCLLFWVLIAFCRKRTNKYSYLPKSVFIKPWLCMMIFEGLGIIYTLLGKTNRMDFGTIAELAGISSFGPILYFSVINSKIKELKYTIGYVFICLFIGSLFTIRAEHSLGGDAARALTGMGGDNAEYFTVLDAYLSGVWGFGMVYGVGMMTPILVFSINKFKTLMKLIVIILILTFFTVAYMAQYSILFFGIAAGLFMCVASLIFHKPLKLVIISLFAISIFTFILVNPNTLSPMLDVLNNLKSALSGSDDYSMRIDAVIGMIDNDPNSYASIRSELYWVSWRGFLAAPILGLIGTFNSVSGTTGGHSMVFDTLGNYGLLGFSFLIGFLVYNYKFIDAVCKITHQDIRWKPLYLIYITTYLIIGLVNPIGSYLVYFTFWIFIPCAPLFFKPRSENWGSMQNGRNKNYFGV